MLNFYLFGVWLVFVLLAMHFVFGDGSEQERQTEPGEIAISLLVSLACAAIWFILVPYMAIKAFFYTKQRSARLFALLIMGGVIIGCGSSPKDSGASTPVQAAPGLKKSKLTISALGLRGRNFEVDAMLKQAEGYTVGVSWFEGGIFAEGTAGPAVDKVIASPNVDRLIVSGGFARPKAEVPGLWKCNYNDLAKEKWKANEVATKIFKRARPGVALYYKPCTEQDEKNASKVEAVAAAVRQVFQSQGLSVKLINTATSGSETRKNYDLLEKHGELPSLQAPCAYDPDGSEVQSYTKQLDRYKHCELVAAWTQGMNCKPGDNDARKRDCKNKVDWNKIREAIKYGAGDTVSIPAQPATCPPNTDTFVDGAKRGNLWKPEADHQADKHVVMFHNKYLERLRRVEVYKNGKLERKQDFDLATALKTSGGNQQVYSEDGGARPFVRLQKINGGPVQVKAVLDCGTTTFKDAITPSKRYD